MRMRSRWGGWVQTQRTNTKMESVRSETEVPWAFLDFDINLEIAKPQEMMTMMMMMMMMMIEDSVIWDPLCQAWIRLTRIRSRSRSTTRIAELPPSLKVTTARCESRTMQSRNIDCGGEGDCLWRAAGWCLRMKPQILKQKTLGRLRAAATKDEMKELKRQVRHMGKPSVWADTHAVATNGLPRQSKQESHSMWEWKHGSSHHAPDRKKDIHLQWESDHFYAVIPQTQRRRGLR